MTAISGFIYVLLVHNHLYIKETRGGQKRVPSERVGKTVPTPVSAVCRYQNFSRYS